ncbi:MAG: hypothetical protein EOO75_19320, partial [Myxococcales bacterium]
AEDLPTASFAGQQDTYLDVVGPAAILQHVSRASSPRCAPLPPTRAICVRSTARRSITWGSRCASVVSAALSSAGVMVAPPRRDSSCIWLLLGVHARRVRTGTVRHDRGLEASPCPWQTMAMAGGREGPAAALARAAPASPPGHALRGALSRPGRGDR